VTLRNGQWTNRPDPMFDHSHEYPHSNILREGTNQTKPLYDRWWVIVLQLAVIAAHTHTGRTDPAESSKR